PAIQVMQDKLKQQEAAGISGRDLYTTYANLGTAMMIESLHRLLSGDMPATQQLNDSLHWVGKSIEVNPEAHFGREVWQVELGEFLLDAAKTPDRLLNHDMVGD